MSDELLQNLGEDSGALPPEQQDPNNKENPYREPGRTPKEVKNNPPF
ncbi:hypothetical protein [Heliorestis acidaminivorans]|nr:hypothetical protein [Heliorestis acidaminivorans]